MQNVVIRRVGTAAQAFDINAQTLPVVSSSPLSITGDSGSVTVNFTNSLDAELFLRTSINLVTWTSSSLGVSLSPPVLTNVQRSTVAPAQFHALSRVQYSPLAPQTLYNRTLTLYFSGAGTLVNSFNSAGGGTFAYNGSPGVILGYSWTQGIYDGYLWPIYYDRFNPLTLHLFFTSASAGSFSGSYYDSLGNYLGDISGTFTLSAP